MAPFFETLQTLTGTSYFVLGKLSPDLPIEPPDPDSEDAWVALAMENNPLVLERTRAAQAAAHSETFGRVRPVTCPY
jgi:outer membrane protein